MLNVSAAIRKNHTGSFHFRVSFRVRSCHNPTTMEVIIQPNQEAAAALVSRIVTRELRANPNLVLGLATGQTMECVYRHFVLLHQTEKLDFSLCRTFNLDEYVGLFPSDPNSYRYYMNHHLFRHVNIDPRNTYLPNGLANDLDEECRRYEATIKRFGGIDLQLLGIGKAGHIGFNEPLSALRSRTRVKALTPTTLKQNSAPFGGEEHMPRRAITMGVGTILEGRRCLLLATGESKAEVIAKAVEGPITSMISATALQLHSRATVIVDEAAAGKLVEKDYYRWIFANEPEWEEYR
jgi:glucosamine-6-phosphate deaminase